MHAVREAHPPELATLEQLEVLDQVSRLALRHAEPQESEYRGVIIEASHDMDRNHHLHVSENGQTGRYTVIYTEGARSSSDSHAWVMRDPANPDDKPIYGSTGRRFSSIREANMSFTKQDAAFFIDTIVKATHLQPRTDYPVKSGKAHV
jgi:hypothetical protein